MASLAAALCAFAVGCERHRVPATGDAATTGAPVSIEPIGADASTTSATLPVEQTIKEQPPLAPAREAGATTTTAAESDAAALPRWVPRDATLSIIASGDRDRNLGIAAPAPAASPSKMTVDAGGVAVDIEIRSRP